MKTIEVMEPGRTSPGWRVYSSPAQIQAFCEALLDRWNLSPEDNRSEPGHGPATVRPRGQDR